MSDISAQILSPSATVAGVCAGGNASHAIAAALARRLALPLLADCGQTPDAACLLAIVDDEPPADFQIQLRFPATKLAPLCVDFLSDRLHYRRQFGGGRQQPLARALGLKKAAQPRVVDATAGLGRDAFIMASLGCEVRMLERNRIIHALLEDGWRRLALVDRPLADRLQLYLTDSCQWLKQNDQPVDVVYLDPMYPHRSKSALVKKEMRVLRSLVGDDQDVPLLLQTALSHARNRVVVKRPKTAPPLPGLQPSHCITSRNTRYDIYLTALASTMPSRRDGDTVTQKSRNT